MVPSPNKSLPVLLTYCGDSEAVPKMSTSAADGVGSGGGNSASTAYPQPILPAIATFWCHECDVSVTLQCRTPPLSCPHCGTDDLVEMELPLSVISPNDDEDFQSTLLLLSEIASSFADASPHSSGSTSKQPSVDSIPTVHVTEIDLVCAVCTDELAIGSEVKRLPCSHLYHGDCIAPWLSRENSCPLCRTAIMVDKECGEDENGDADEWDPVPLRWPVDFRFLLE